MSVSKEQSPAKACHVSRMEPDGPEDGAASTSAPERADANAADESAEWIRAAQGGDRDAMERLILHYQDRVWRRARYRIGDPEEAWEVAQDVLIICLRKIGQYRGEAPFWHWLARIVDNQVKNRFGWWRRRRARTFSLQDMGRGEDGEEKEWDPPDTTPSPRQQAAAHEEMEALERTMGELSADHREVLLLRFGDGQSYEEIADTLRLTLGTVKSRINRARAELREKMQKYL